MDMVLNVVGLVLIPCVLALFGWMGAISKSISALELQVAREYVSMANLREIMAPIQKDVRDLERLMLRIADRLHVPAVNDEYHRR